MSCGAECVQGTGMACDGQGGGGGVVQCDRTGRGTGTAMKSRGRHCLTGEAGPRTSPWSKGAVGGLGRADAITFAHQEAPWAAGRGGQEPGRAGTRELQHPEEGHRALAAQLGWRDMAEAEFPTSRLVTEGTTM